MTRVRVGTVGELIAALGKYPTAARVLSQVAATDRSAFYMYLDVGDSEYFRWDVNPAVLTMSHPYLKTLANAERAVPSDAWMARDRYESIRGRECEITLEPRPDYCDRGNFIAKLFPDTGSKLADDLDAADGWLGGRYYFDHDHAKLEIEAWLRKRKQWLDV